MALGQPPAGGMVRVLGFWRDVRVQRALFQLLFAAAVVFVGYLLITNLTSELDKTNLEALPFVDFSGGFPLKLDFLNQRAGFGLPETSFGMEYSANDSYADAYLTGLMNTVRVAVVGVLLASVVGLVAGVSRLSTNWLVSQLARGYVEIFRNVPLLVQLIFWYTAVFLKFPRVEESETLGIAFLSNRGIALPWGAAGDRFAVWLLVLVAALAVAAWVLRYRERRQARTGAASHPWWWAAGVFALIGFAGYVATGAPLTIEQPTLENRLLTGGLQFTPEFAALLTGLVLYTGAFIAELVRGSIQAISKGQTEASAALGLNSLQRLRFVILPQAMRIMIPPLTNQYLNLMKNSSLAVVVAFPDLFRVTKITINQSGQAVPMIVLVMVTYLVMSLVISTIMNVMNSRFKVPSH